MRTALVVTAAIAATVSLAACQKPAANTAASNATAVGGAATSAASTATGGESMNPADLPRAKPGLWKMKMTNSMMPRPIEFENCITPEDNKVDWSGQQKKNNCTAPDIARGFDGSIHGSATCTMDRGMTMAMQFRMSGDYQSHYNMHMDEDVSGAPMAQLNGKHTMDVEATYAGACMPGQHGTIHAGG
ncbi:MAG TPA: DUF3617 family protein [Caulobacteraceae bacterium]|jgi:hypothetical protein|nr:DUF3617 family protein [Caulobacteraceae bacterium]